MRSLVTAEGYGKTAIAANMDGSMVAISNYHSQKITILSLPAWEVVHTFGSDGAGTCEFNCPRYLCFTRNGTLLVGEFYNHRIQEVKITGEHVRYFHEFSSDVELHGLTLHGDAVIASLNDAADCILVLDYNTGDVIRSFGKCGVDTHEFGANEEVCVAPNGNHLLVADSANDRVSVFTLDGKHVANFGYDSDMASPLSVCASPSGEVFVMEEGGKDVLVFFETPKLEYQFVMRFGLGQCDRPISAAVVNRALYVLDAYRHRVVQFE